MTKYFDVDGNPTPEAAPFFYYPEGSDIPEPTAEHESRWEAVAGALPNFDGDLILRSLIEGWSVEETIERGRDEEAEHDEAMDALADDFEFRLGRDMSMSG